MVQTNSALSQEDTFHFQLGEKNAVTIFFFGSGRKKNVFDLKFKTHQYSFFLGLLDPLVPTFTLLRHCSGTTWPRFSLLRIKRHIILISFFYSFHTASCFQLLPSSFACPSVLFTTTIAMPDCRESWGGGTNQEDASEESPTF